MTESKRAQKNLIIIFGLLIIVTAAGFILTKTRDNTVTDTNITQSKDNQSSITTVERQDEIPSYAKSYGDNYALISLVNPSAPNANDLYVEYKENQTLLDAMNTLSKDGRLKFEMTGEGKNAFLISVNGYKASTGKHEFWKVMVNTTDAMEGIGSLKLQKNDHIIIGISTY
jgi:hypothetical protein